MKKIIILFLIFFGFYGCSVFKKDKIICLNVVGLPSEILVEKKELKRRKENNEIKGIVLNKEDSIPLENVKIIISEKNKIVNMLETDSLGKFETELKNGEYSIKFEKQFFRPIGDSLSIKKTKQILIKTFLGQQDLEIFYQTDSPRLLKQRIELQNQKRKKRYFGT